MDCIRCRVKMKKKSQDGVLVDECPECSGIWLDAGELDMLQRGLGKEDADLLAEARRELVDYARRMATVKGLCPKCQASPLQQVRKRGVELDCCVRCGGTFFDATELEAVMEKGGPQPGIVATLVLLFRRAA